MELPDVFSYNEALVRFDRASPRTSWRQRVSGAYAKVDSHLRELVRYTAVAAVALAVDVGALYGCTALLQMHYLASAAVGFTLGLLTNYLLCVHLVFARRRMRSAWREFQIFAAIGIIGLLLNELFMWTFVEWFEIHYLFSKLGSAGLVFMWNFGVRKLALFR